MRPRRSVWLLPVASFSSAFCRPCRDSWLLGLRFSPGCHPGLRSIVPSALPEKLQDVLAPSAVAWFPDHATCATEGLPFCPAPLVRWEFGVVYLGLRHASPRGAAPDILCLRAFGARETGLGRITHISAVASSTQPRKGRPMNSPGQGTRSRLTPPRDQRFPPFRSAESASHMTSRNT